MFTLITFLITFVLGLFAVRFSDIVYKCKWLVSLVCLRIHKYHQRSRLDFYDLKTEGQPEKVGFVVHPTEVKLESPQPESHLEKADDKILCYGVNSKKECLVVSITRLPNQRAEASVFLRLASGKIYQMEHCSDFQQPNGEKNVFSCGDLQMYYLSPMRKWRIFFSGFLKETSDENPDDCRMTYVKFSLFWRAASDVYDGTSDMEQSTIIESVAKANWNSSTPPLKILFNVLDFYGQAGVIMGMICVEDVVEDYEIYLFGQRMRYLGNASLSKEIEFSHTLGYVHKNGTYIHFGDSSIENVAEKMKFGYVVKPDAQMMNIEKLDIVETSKRQEIKGTIVAGRTYAICGSDIRTVGLLHTEEKIVNITLMKFYLDGRKGTGIRIKGKVSPRKLSRIVPREPVPAIGLCPTVVAFTEFLCQSSEVTGGKGSSLGKLTSLSTELQSFKVPSGIVVTTSAYKGFINAGILKEVENLENVLYGKMEGDPKVACQSVQNKIIATNIPTNIRDDIVKNLKKVFGEKFESTKFAVRSSATGEDTEQMSAAGQMDTFLGVEGVQNIIDAVKKCWASQFGFIAVQYKRRYGQSMNTPMAVVIQEMVPCDVAGVIFTCDPVTGRPTKISISANFGLGESVVSASEEPDVIEFLRNYKDELKIHQVIVGSKQRKIVVAESGTNVVDIPEKERKECCLSSEKALELGNIAIKIEKHYRSRRDIEWGFHNGILHIFQSRPVTSGTRETDFEIEHEFDGPYRIENDYFSVSNAGEVLPGAMAPFSLDVFFRMSNIMWQGEKQVEWQFVRSKYFPIGWMTMCNHCMFNISDMFRESKPESRGPLEEATMLAFFGRIIDNDEIFEIAAERHAESRLKRRSLLGSLRMVKNMLFSDTRLKQWKKFYSSYKLPTEECKTSSDLLKLLTSHCCDLKHAMGIHMVCTQSSTMWNMLIFSTLSQAKGGIDNDVYTDFANLLTNKGDVESADVPAAMQSLAFHISNSIKPEEFKAMKTEDALNWLKNTKTSAGEKFKDFIEKHGHRCFKELDFHTITWGTDSKPLIKSLQNLVGNIREDAAEIKNKSIKELISELKVPVGLLSKLKLMLLVHLSRNGVRQRESSKSVLIKGLDVWRKGYRALAKLMVSEGRLPDEDLLFFMTLDEVTEVLDNRSPRILSKAYHRRKLYPKLDSYRFPEIMRGFPKPINMTKIAAEPTEGDLTMKGIPVSQGTAKGYLRVAVTLEEAADLKPGEILLAYGTDIGWSPYFPTLAGVATELGGLISHGAVVSREYGLPCVAALHGATARFRTGDYVLLDGNRGILQRLSKPKEENSN